jgi:hypothetical protein
MATGHAQGIVLRPGMSRKQPNQEFVRMSLFNEDGSPFVGGSMGPKGEPGPQGPMGPQGPQGLQGLPGLKGDKGDQGVIGPQGQVGPQGVQGIAGPQGLQGEKGDIGPRGLQGLVGSPGPQGLPGEPGADSTVPGPPGPAGDTGPQGLQGEPGADSTVPGPQGPEGPMGPQGLQGEKGFVGAQGPVGPEGPAGPQGLKGDTGDTGSTGAQGLPGPEGPIGPQGLKGDTGNTGAVGPAGAEGPQGPQGLVGAQGPQGLKGDPGDPGAEGAQGPAGPPTAWIAPEAPSPRGEYTIWIDTDEVERTWPPPVVTTLPASPWDGQEVYFLANAAQGIMWHLRYRVAAVGPYKWEVIGGSSLQAQDTSIRDLYISAVYPLWDVLYDASSGNAPATMTLTLPLAGDYDITIASGQTWPDQTAVRWWRLGYRLGGLESSDLWSAMTGSTAAAQYSQMFRTFRHSGLAKDLLVAVVASRQTNDFIPRATSRRLEIRPVRVG